ncbi:MULTISPECIES: hypothetical protein [Methylobacterium]|jgi:hypothetical protein|uniref:DUF1648 domain-containing protein n=1 Tax=Methylobacterium hispanicum TaxID=270350 RepID=A0AAV4ZGZ9_9HYPH|nr:MULTISPECIES: hypothetical protein [Methylobacterium]GJD87492.1 hypothetical protein BHAOGJBA_0996 [Methylobacterium hispanicum]
MPFAVAKLLPLLGHAACLVTLAAMAGINLYAAPRIGTPKVPMQWSLSGEPTWLAGKAAGLWLPVAIAVVVAASLLLKARQSEPPAGVSDWIALVAACGVMLGIHAWHVSAVMAWAAKQP